MKRDNQKGHMKEVNGVEPEDDVLLVQRKIALRAYELYLQRGGVDGHAQEDWLQAEREIMPKHES